MDHIAVFGIASRITHSIYFTRMAELEEGSGTEASDTELLEEQFDSIQSEDYARWADQFLAFLKIFF